MTSIGREDVWAMGCLAGALLRMKLWLAVSLSTILCCICLRKFERKGLDKLLRSRRRFLTLAVRIGLLIGLFSVVNEILFFVFPSTIWSPFAWNSFIIYKPASLDHAIQGLCLDGADPKLCLSESDWKVLSSGALSSRHNKEVEAVFRGVQYAQHESTGLIVNILARDVHDAIPPLRQNVEALAHFFPKLAVVIFENDSKDGTREAVKAWASETQGYTVDLMECEEADDCKLGQSRRYKKASISFTSAVGHMASFRNRLLNYIFSSPKYSEFSHMLVMDLDLQISVSPLGILHSIGSEPHNAVASSGEMISRASFGTLSLPYDMTAFRPTITRTNEWLLNLHQRFCELYPPGHSWRNLCDDLSPFHLAANILQDQIHNGNVYEVESSFNGAALYPLNKIREARYSAGDDGQQCEHVAFNEALEGTFYVNPKWKTHIDPDHPPGESGSDAVHVVEDILFDPKAFMLVVGGRLLSGILFAIASMVAVVAFRIWFQDLADCKNHKREPAMKKKMSYLPTSEEEEFSSDWTTCKLSTRIYRYTSKSPSLCTVARVSNMLVDDIPFFSFMVCGLLLSVCSGFSGGGFSIILAQSQNWFTVESLLKMTFRKPRPYYCGSPSVVMLPGDHFSFPSGHTLRAFAVSAILADPDFKWNYGLPGWLFMVLAGLSAWARVALGKHTIMDVVTGALVGTFLVTCLEPTISETMATCSALFFAGFGFLGLWDLLSTDDKDGFCTITGLTRKKDKLCSLCLCFGYCTFWLWNTSRNDS